MGMHMLRGRREGIRTVMIITSMATITTIDRALHRQRTHCRERSTLGGARRSVVGLAGPGHAAAAPAGQPSLADRCLRLFAGPRTSHAARLGERRGDGVALDRWCG